MPTVASSQACLAFCRCSVLQSVQVTKSWAGPGNKVLFNAHGAVVE